jgi:hypothetical protein
MEKLPRHTEAHAIWVLLGDLNEITGGMKTVARANKEAERIWASAAGTG